MHICGIHSSVSDDDESGNDVNDGGTDDANIDDNDDVNDDGNEGSNNSDEGFLKPQHQHEP